MPSFSRRTSFLKKHVGNCNWPVLDCEGFLYLEAKAIVVAALRSLRLRTVNLDAELMDKVQQLSELENTGAGRELLNAANAGELASPFLQTPRAQCLPVSPSLRVVCRWIRRSCPRGAARQGDLSAFCVRLVVGHGRNPQGWASKFGRANSTWTREGERER